MKLKVREESVTDKSSRYTNIIDFILLYLITSFLLTELVPRQKSMQTLAWQMNADEVPAVAHWNTAENRIAAANAKAAAAAAAADAAVKVAKAQADAKADARVAQERARALAAEAAARVAESNTRAELAKAEARVVKADADARVAQKHTKVAVAETEKKMIQSEYSKVSSMHERLENLQEKGRVEEKATLISIMERFSAISFSSSST